MTLKYWMMVEGYQISKKKSAVQFPVVKSPLYLTETCQVVNYFPVLWREHVNLLPEKREKKR